MSCNYRVGGKDNAVLTDVFYYVEDTPVDQRDMSMLEQVLIDRNIAVKQGDALIAVDSEGVMEDLNNVNEGARAFFGVMGDLLNLNKVGDNTEIEIDENILSLMYPVAKNLHASVSKDGKIERIGTFVQQEESIDPIITEAFQKKAKVDQVTEQLIVNLTKQIARLERLQETEATIKRKNELVFLRGKLKKIKKGHEKVSDYYEYVDYVEKLAKRAQKYFEKVEQEYAVSYKDMPSEDRASLLMNISQFKQTLDAFFNEDRGLSMVNLLQDKLAEMTPAGEKEQTVKGEMLDDLVVAIADLKKLNDRYLEIGIPIQADQLMEMAPIGVNKKIDATIATLQKALDENDMSVPYQGLEKRDSRAQKIIQETGGLTAFVRVPGKGTKLAERKRRLLELNITQLKEKRIGREAIIKELRETHKDASAFSVYADPLVYNDELSIQLFANTVKAGFFESNQNTIDAKYELEPELKRFLEWKGVSSSNPAKAYEDLYETVELSFKTEAGYETVKILSIVQPYDIVKFTQAKNEMFRNLKKKHGFPEDPSDYDDFFKSPEGRAYNAAVGAWHEKNTEHIRDAAAIVKSMEDNLKKLGEERNAAFRGNNQELGKELSYQYAILEKELQKVVRTTRSGRTYVGKLTVPKSSLYSNSKYDKLPAPAKRFLNVYMDLYQRHQKKLGVTTGMPTNPWEKVSYMAPTVRISTIDALQRDTNGKGFLNSLQLLGQDMFTMQETDEDFSELVDMNGERMQFIPRHFTNIVEESKVSRDIVNSLVKFIDMANRYEAKGKLLGVVNVMNDAVASRKYKTMTATGNYLVDRAAQQLGINVEVTKEGKDTQTYKHLENFIDNVIYGETIKRQEKEHLAGLSTTKSVSFLTSLTAASRLSFNMLQSVNQLLIDSTMNNAEGWAGQFYSITDLYEARTKVLANISYEGKGEGLAPKFTKQSKLQQMMEMFDALQEEGRAFDINTGNLFKRMASDPFSQSFMTQRGAEFISTSEKLVALSLSMRGKLKDKSGKVIKNKNGKPATLWDLYQLDNKGRLKLDSRVANFGKREQAQFANKLNGIVKKTNQLKGGMDKTLLERQNSTRLVFIFRKFIPPAYRKRFGHSNGGYHVDVELGDLTEGFYITTARALSSAGRSFMKGQFAESFKTLFIPSKSKYVNDVQLQNMRRFWHEQIYITVLYYLTQLLRGMMDDDDEYDNYAAHFAIYQMYRMRTELTAFRDISEAGRILKNPTAASQVLTDLQEFFLAGKDYTAYQMGLPVPEKDVFYQRRAGRYQKGDLKVAKQFADVAPFASGIWKSTDPEKASKYYMQLED